ncbi:MAG: hypothetical protein D6681_20730 [Calditrichaeota bacterium]|nr:MAG: hypothetical protein D6681_20730 [Calditrichota bacterium]
MRTVVLMFLTVGLFYACGIGPREPRDLRKAETTVIVQNRYFLDMTIYVVRGNHRVRLGTVPASSTRELLIPRYIVAGTQSLRFQADPVGEQATPVTEEVSVVPGEQLELILMPGIGEGMPDRER